MVSHQLDRVQVLETQHLAGYPLHPHLTGRAPQPRAAAPRPSAPRGRSLPLPGKLFRTRLCSRVTLSELLPLLPVQNGKPSPPGGTCHQHRLASPSSEAPVTVRHATFYLLSVAFHCNVRSRGTHIFAYFTYFCILSASSKYFDAILILY